MQLKKIPHRLIGEILIEEGFLDPPSLEEALKIQKKEGGLIGEILIQRGAISEEQLVVGLSRQLSIPFIRLSNYRVNRNTVQLVPKEVAQRYLFLSFEQDGQEVSVAMSDPANPEALEELKRRISASVQVFLAKPSEIKQAIGTYYRE